MTALMCEYALVTNPTTVENLWASRLELVCDCCLTELALVVSRTKAAFTNKVEGASPLACP